MREIGWWEVEVAGAGKTFIISGELTFPGVEQNDVGNEIFKAAQRHIERTVNFPSGLTIRPPRKILSKPSGARPEPIEVSDVPNVRIWKIDNQ